MRHAKTLAGVFCCLLAAAVVPGQSRPVKARVFGTVLDTKGKPAAGVEVRAVAFAAAGLPNIYASWLHVPLKTAASTRTDARGRFVLQVDPSVPLGVVAVRGATERSAVAAPVAPAGQLELRLHPVLKVKGRAVAERGTGAAPLVGATIHSTGPVVSAVTARPFPDAVFGLLEEVKTGKKGEFEIAVLGGVDCTLECAALAAKVTCRRHRPGGEPLEIRAVIHEVAGTLRDRAGKPLPAARVRRHPGLGETRTNAKGRFDVELPALRSLIFEAEGFHLGMLYVGKNGRNHRVELRRSPRVRARFLDKRGDPLVGVEFCVLRMANGAGASTGDVVLRTTASDGTLTMWGRGGGLTAWVRVGDRFHRILDISPGERDVELGDIAVRPVSVQGVVLGVDGAPAAHVPLFALPLDDPFGGRFALGQHPIAYTDHGGKFVLAGLVPGKYEIGCRSSRSLPMYVEHEVRTHGKLLRLRLKPASRMRGRVLDQNGKPVAGAIVQAQCFSDATDRIRRFGQWTNYTRTDSGGRFDLAAVMERKVHHVSARSRSSALLSRSIKVVPGATAEKLEFVLAPRQKR